MNLAVANTKRSRHLTESLPSATSFPKALSAVAEESENSAPSTRSAWEEGREADGASSFVSSGDEQKESAGLARVLQRRGHARVRELVKMAESLPVETNRLSACWKQNQ